MYQKDLMVKVCEADQDIVTIRRATSIKQLSEGIIDRICVEYERCESNADADQYNGGNLRIAMRHARYHLATCVREGWLRP
jgi:hypothetical protein